MTLSTTMSRHSGVVLMHLRGEITCATAGQFRTAVSTAILTNPRPSRLVVDLSDVAATDETGLGSLVTADRICRHVGIQLDVRHPGPILKPLFGTEPQDAPHRQRGTSDAQGSARHEIVTESRKNRHTPVRS